MATVLPVALGAPRKARNDLVAPSPGGAAPPGPAAPPLDAEMIERQWRIVETLAQGLVDTYGPEYRL